MNIAVELCAVTRTDTHTHWQETDQRSI